MIFQRAGTSAKRSPDNRRNGGQEVQRAACPAWTLSAICPCTAGNSRTFMDTVGPHQAKNTSPRRRESPGHGPFPQVVAGVGFEPT